MKVLCLGAGGPAGVNFCQAAKDAGYHVVGVDENPWHVEWARAVCDEAHLCGSYDDAVDEWADGDTLVWAQPESGVRWLADTDIAPARKMVPSMQTVALCADKFECGLTWRRAGLRDDRIELAALEVGYYQNTTTYTGPYPAWVRARHGAGAKGALLAENQWEVDCWIELWHRKQPDWDFVAEEYLPGRDYCWSAVYWHGELMGSFARERLEWMYPHLAPSGRTGTPTVAVTVHDQDVNDMAEAAVDAVSDATTPPHGVYCVDLREDWEGVPRPTEINAGRWATTSPLHAPDLVRLQLDLAAGLDPTPVGSDCVPAGRTLIRHIDCPTLTVEEPCPAIC